MSTFCPSFGFASIFQSTPSRLCCALLCDVTLSCNSKQRSGLKEDFACFPSCIAHTPYYQPLDPQRGSFQHGDAVAKNYGKSETREVVIFRNISLVLLHCVDKSYKCDLSIPSLRFRKFHSVIIRVRTFLVFMIIWTKHEWLVCPLKVATY